MPLCIQINKHCPVSNCINLICDWMANNRLKLNEDKMQVIWLGTCQQLGKITAQSLTLPNATVQFTNNVNDLGVLLDSQLTMADHTSALSWSCFFQLRQLRSIKQSLTLEATSCICHQPTRLLQQYVSWCLVVSCCTGCK